MVLFKRGASHIDNIATSGSPERSDHSDDKVSITHQETASIEHVSKWKFPKSGGGDVAQALFNSPDEVAEPIDPAEEKRVVRKIDMMILPYLVRPQHSRAAATSTDNMFQGRLLRILLHR